MNKDLLKSKPCLRFEKSGRALEALHKEADEFYAEHRKYFDIVEPWTKKFQALNNSIKDVMKQPAINPVEVERRNGIIFAIGDLAKDYKDEHAKLVYEHPAQFDKIYAAGEVFKQTAVALQNMYKDEALCLPHIEKAERTLEEVTAIYNEMKQRMATLYEVLEKQKKLYYQVVE